jgi:hypothetical protein
MIFFNSETQKYYLHYRLDFKSIFNMKENYIMSCIIIFSNWEMKKNIVYAL